MDVDKYAAIVSDVINNDEYESCSMFSQKGKIIQSKGWVMEEANRKKAWEKSQALVDKVTTQ